MTVIRDVIRDVIRPVIRNVIREPAGGGELEPGEVPRWSFVGPVFQVYQASLPFTLDMNPYVKTPPGEPVTSWTNTGSATIGTSDGILSLNQAVGSYPITVTATNINGSATSNQFTIEVLAGEAPAVPEWDTVPNFYSVYGIEGGNRVPPAPAGAGTAGVLFSAAEAEGVDMNEFILNSPTPWPVTPGSWIVTPGNVVTIDANGILKGKVGTTVGQYSLTVTCSNANGSATSSSFTWEVVLEEGWETFWDKATAHPDLNGMLLARTGGDQSYLNHLAETATATGNTAALTGQEWTGNAYSEKDVGYGVLLSDAPKTRLIGPLANVAGLPDNGMLIEASGQVIFRIEAIPFGDTFARILSLSNEHDTPVPDDEPYNRNDFSEIAIHRPDDDDGLTLAVRTRPTNDTDPAAQFNGWHGITVSGLSYSVGSIIDARFRCSATDGLRFWVTIDGVPAATNLHDPTAIPADEQIAAIDYAALGGDVNTGIYESEITVIYSKVVPYGDLPVATIEGWPSWTHPVPILPADHMNPTYVHVPVGTQPPTGEPTLLFEENFDYDQDWNTGMGYTEDSGYWYEGDTSYGRGLIASWERQTGKEKGYLPQNSNDTVSKWTAGISYPFWSPGKGYPNSHEVIEIDIKNKAMVQPRTGDRCMVFWRDCTDDGSPSGWRGDGGLDWTYMDGRDATKREAPGKLQEIYVEFYVKFSNNFIETYYASPYWYNPDWNRNESSLGNMKFFRILRFTGDWSQYLQYFGMENTGPRYIHQFVGGTKGHRHHMTFHRYKDTDPAIREDPPSWTLKNNGCAWNSGGPMTGSYLSTTKGMGINGSDPVIPNKLGIEPDPLPIVDSSSELDGYVAHMDHILGTETNHTWVKHAYWVKCNSAPGTRDGGFGHWIDDQRVHYATDFHWFGTDTPSQDDIYFNTFSVGGNSYWQYWQLEHGIVGREDWYAIDNIKAYDGIPLHLRDTEGS